MSEPVVALVLSPEQWVETFHRHCADHGGARVRCVVVDPQVAIEEAYDVLVVSDRWPALTRSLVGAVHAAGRRVLAVSAGGTRDAFVAGLGVDTVTPVVTPTELVAAVQALVVAPVPRPAPVASAVRSSDGAGPIPAPARIPGLVAVSGPTGSGVTEVALAIAVALADRGEPVVLVDAAAGVAGIALRLGLPLEPHLGQAVAAVEYGVGRLDDALLSTGRRRLRVVAGPDGAAAPTGSEVLAVVRALAERGARVVVDQGGHDPARPIALDDAAPALHPASVHPAAVALIVADGAPAGIVQLLDTIGHLPAPDVTRVRAVVNRAPQRRADQDDLAAEIARVFPVSVAMLPDDPRVRAAAWAGDPVGRSPFTTAVARLVAGLGSR